MQGGSETAGRAQAEWAVSGGGSVPPLAAAPLPLPSCTCRQQATHGQASTWLKASPTPAPRRPPGGAGQSPRRPAGSLTSPTCPPPCPPPKAPPLSHPRTPTPPRGQQAGWAAPGRQAGQGGPPPTRRGPPGPGKAVCLWLSRAGQSWGNGQAPPSTPPQARLRKMRVSLKGAPRRPAFRVRRRTRQRPSSHATQARPLWPRPCPTPQGAHASSAACQPKPCLGAW